jgi:outer membrane protein assembly factor BamB
MLIGTVLHAVLDAQIGRRRQPPVKPATLILPADIAWETSLPAPPSAGAVLTESGTVIVPLGSGDVHGIDLATGATQWTRPLRATTAPATTGPLAMLGSGADVMAVEASTGEERWRATVAAPVRVLIGTPPAVYALTDTSVLALDAQTGRRLWSHALDRPPSGLAVGTRAVAVALENRVVQIARADGRLLWSRALEGTLTTPAWSDNLVVVGSAERMAWGLSGDSGDIEWTWRLGARVTGVAADRTQVYVATIDTLLRALNRGNGHQRWQQDTGTRPLGAPVALDGAVLLTGLRPALAAYDIRTGAALGAFEITGVSSATPVVGPPLVTPALRPGGVSVVLLLRNGQLIGLRSTTLAVREPPPTPLLALPGRAMPRERLPMSQP